MEKLDILVSKRLLNLKVFKVQLQAPFLWANGWKSPVYCDDKKILSYPKERDFFKLEISRIIVEQFPETEAIAAVATNAIAQGVLVAHQLSMPFVYVYPQPKNHGLENQIEGDIRPKQKVVVFENQISLGIHALQVVEALQMSGCEVLGVLSIINLEIPGVKEKFEQVGIPLVSLSNFSTILREAVEIGRLTSEDAEQIRLWHNDPTNWDEKEAPKKTKGVSKTKKTAKTTKTQKK